MEAGFGSPPEEEEASLGPTAHGGGKGAVARCGQVSADREADLLARTSGCSADGLSPFRRPLTTHPGKPSQARANPRPSDVIIPRRLHDDAAGDRLMRPRSDARVRPFRFAGRNSKRYRGLRCSKSKTRRRAAVSWDDCNEPDSRYVSSAFERRSTRNAGGVSPGRPRSEPFFTGSTRRFDRLGRSRDKRCWAARDAELEKPPYVRRAEATRRLEIPAVEAALLGDGSQLNAQLAANLKVRLGACHARVERSFCSVPCPPDRRTLDEKGRRRPAAGLSVRSERRTAETNQIGAWTCLTRKRSAYSARRSSRAFSRNHLAASMPSKPASPRLPSTSTGFSWGARGPRSRSSAEPLRQRPRDSVTALCKKPLLHGKFK